MRRRRGRPTWGGRRTARGPASPPSPSRRPLPLESGACPFQGERSGSSASCTSAIESACRPLLCCLSLLSPRGTSFLISIPVVPAAKQLHYGPHLWGMHFGG